MTPEIFKIKDDLLEEMVSYMNDYSPGYSQEDVNECSRIIDHYFQKLNNASGDNKQSEILKAVKDVVIALNDLNDSCDDPIIETLQRDYLCDVIIKAAEHCGLKTDNDDVTEKWREW